MRTLTPAQFLTHIRNLNSKFEAELFRTKQDIGLKSMNHFKTSFNRAGFVGGGGKKWAKRRASYPWPIMKKSNVGGGLRNSITYKITPAGIDVGTSTPYAKYHNDDETAGWTRNQHSTMPITRRQFLGNSSVLEKWIERRLIQTLTYTFR